jgi:ubiquinone biosynthesis protein
MRPIPAAMAEPTRPAAPAPSASPLGVEEPAFEILVETRKHGLFRRLLTTQRHLLGLLFGGLAASLRERPKARRHGIPYRLGRLVSAVAGVFLDRKLAARPFPVQLRRRLEILGPTYIKLGQILSLREDLLPPAITGELKNLLDRLPVVPFPRFMEIVAADLDRPVEEVFEWIDPRPLGSASIAQTHRGTLKSGESVILKVVKPGIRDTLHRDARLLWLLGHLLQLLFPRVRPKRMIDEFVHYTLREVNLRLEADNAETFAANFKDMPDVVFPRIYREASGTDLLTMEYLSGFKPNSPEARGLSDVDRDYLIDLGASAIIRMIYRDGFFHADLHPGNLMILAGPKVGFIDLGMVGRFSEELKRTLLYYYYCLVTGDVDNAARYLAMVAEAGPGGDPAGFRREVAEICRRWRRAASFQGFSLGQLIMESVARGVEFRMYFPVEMVLMVKAIVTYEGVGQILKPGFDVASVSQAHINRIFLHQFSPLRLIQESLRGTPELIDALVKAPMLVTEGMRLLEQHTRRPPENPFAGIRGTIFGGFCFLAGAVLLAARGPLWAAALLFAVGLLMAVRRGR